MTLFDVLNEIITKKQIEFFDDDENKADVNAFQLQKWLSMHSPSYAKMLNISVNQFKHLTSDKDLIYMLLRSILPKSYNRRINYIKKPQVQKNKPPVDKDAVTDAEIAESMEISIREVELMRKYDTMVGQGEKV